MNTYDNVPPTIARSRPRFPVSRICANARWPRITPAGANTNANTTDNVASVLVSWCWEVGAGPCDALAPGRRAPNGSPAKSSPPNGSPPDGAAGPPPQPPCVIGVPPLRPNTHRFQKACQRCDHAAFATRHPDKTHSSPKLDVIQRTGSAQ